MIDTLEIKQKINEIEKKSKELENILDIEKTKREILILKEKQSSSDFYKDLELAKFININLKHLEDKVKRYNELIKANEILKFAIEMYEEFPDDILEEDIQLNLKECINKIEELELEGLLKGKYDCNYAICTLHSGAGGTEAQDWVEMLYRMFIRYSENKGFKIEEIDKLLGDEAGIKSVTFKVIGDNAYGYLKAEKGIHRLVRISPFDAKKRRHTSFASLEVIPEIEDKNEIILKQEDLKIDTYRSSGAGGQHVNKTESAIRITHIPTGIVVQCQNERSQIQNKEKAMNMLINKLAELKDRENEEKNRELKGEQKKIEWGSQIMTYVFCPYTLVKDLRTGYEMTNIQDVMNGNIDGFIREYLKEYN